MEMNNSIRVAIRVRSSSSTIKSVCSESSHSLVLRSDSGLEYKYNFDSVLEYSAQEKVFQETCLGYLNCLFKGESASLFAYGPTGSGKTHTIFGTEDNPGIVYRAVPYLLEKCKLENAKLVFSFMEIYNDKIFDLLEISKNDLPIRVTENGNVVCGLSQHKIDTIYDFQQLFDVGGSARSVGQTNFNTTSSRSHAILTLKIIKEDSIGLLNLVDLAGSEDNKTSGNIGQTMIESCEIHSSLLALSQVISALNQRQSGMINIHIPYRNSKLTRVLQNSLGGNSHGVMIACVSDDPKHFSTTQATLKFASLSRNVKNTITFSKILATGTISDPRCKDIKDDNNLERRKLELEQWKKNKESGAPKRKEIEIKEDDSRKKIKTNTALNVSSKLIDLTSISSLACEKISDPTLCARVDQLAHTVMELSKSLPPSNLAVSFVPLTPATKSGYAKDHVIRAKEFESSKDYASALIEYQKAVNLLPDHEKLCKKVSSIKSLINSNFESRAQRNDVLSDVTNVVPVQNFKNQNNLKNVSKFSDVLRILNEGSLADLLNFHCIGQKRAEAILDYRNGGNLFNSVSELSHCGLSSKQIETFIEKNEI